MRDWQITISSKYCPYLLNGHCYKKRNSNSNKDSEEPKCSWNRCSLIRGYHDVDEFYKE